MAIKNWWNNFKEFLEDEFTIHYCQKHTDEEFSRIYGCKKCHIEARHKARMADREDRIEEIKEGVLRALKEKEGLGLGERGTEDAN